MSPALLVLALVAVWSWPPSRDFLLGRVENNVGVFYAKGLLVDRDEAEAVRWYAKSARRGCASGAFNFAFALQQGVGVAPNEREAAVWYEKAAAAGMAEAANNLGLLYANPPHGRPNLVQARAWLRRALPLADPTLAATIRDNLQAMEKDMSPADLAASEDPAAAVVAGLPEVAPRTIPAADTHTAPDIKVRAALDSAQPMREAVLHFLKAKRRLPGPADASDADGLAPQDTPQAHLEIGRGGAIEIRLRGGALNGARLSLVPMLSGANLKWICAGAPLKVGATIPGCGSS
ncbi:MAG: sel1 repeat family protein [Proteobacteria bacterium]|nr:sel1 repeat family protein [Pseudomonadota bacterium]